MSAKDFFTIDAPRRINPLVGPSEKVKWIIVDVNPGRSPIVMSRNKPKKRTST
jgi:hypothetical protein